MTGRSWPPAARHSLMGSTPFAAVVHSASDIWRSRLLKTTDADGSPQAFAFHNPLSLRRRKARGFWRKKVPARIPMTERQRNALLALPDSEEMVVRHCNLDAADLAAIGTARTSATRLGYALQLCCLRYP